MDAGHLGGLADVGDQNALGVIQVVELEVAHNVLEVVPSAVYPGILHRLYVRVHVQLEGAREVVQEEADRRGGVEVRLDCAADVRL